jgi:transposase
MSEARVTQQLLLPGLRFVKEEHNKVNKFRVIHCEKVSEFEVCPKCATKCSTVYDHVNVEIRDAPIRNRSVILKIRKRRFLCKSCKSVFREPVNGIIKRFRTTQRLRSHIRWCASKFMNLKAVQGHCRCSAWLVYKAYYEQIELELRKVKNPWPKTVGIDEHSFLRNSKKRKVDFVTVFIDYNNKRMKEVVLGKSIGDLLNSSIQNIEGRGNVKNVIVDLSPTFRSFAIDYFPKAKLIADKFHVVKLMHPLIHELRRKVIEDHKIEKKRGNPIIKLLLKYRKKLQYYERSVIDKFLDLSPELKEIYWYQQRLYRFYRVKGSNKAREVFIKLTDDMARSKNKKIVSYRNTLRSWHQEILNYFSTKYHLKVFKFLF